MKTVKSEGGAALLLVLFSLLLLASYSWYRSNSLRQSLTIHIDKRLLAAKEALIARAVTDDNRPGSLPCPDLITDDNGLKNHPNDGIADNLTRNDCPAYIGWLPWATLDLAEQTDDSGTRLWYALSRDLRDDDQAQPINSATPGILLLDGRDDIVALIIAPGAAIDGQTRPSNHPADYLDGSNADGSNTFLSQASTPGINDRFLALSRQELMSAVDKRIAGEVRACLEQHASAAANPTHEYPWPAPFSSSSGRGKAGSLFGHIPHTQPGPGPQAELAASNSALQNARKQLGQSSQPGEQMVALQTLNENLLYARIFFDRLYITAKNIALAAQSIAGNFADFDSTLITANSNGRISVSERKAIQNDGSAYQAELMPLLNSLIDSGLDVFPDELSSRNLKLQNAIALTPSIEQLNALREASTDLLSLFSSSHTHNSDIATQLNDSLTRSADALLSSQNALASPSDMALLKIAVNAAQSLKMANEQLQASIADNRLGLPPAEIIAGIVQLEAASSAYTLQQDVTGKQLLAQQLDASHAMVSQISNSGSIKPLRESSLNTLASAITASESVNNGTQLLSRTRTAIDSLTALSNAMLTQGDNLTRESLAARSASFASQLDVFSHIETKTQADMLPYSQSLQLAAVDVQFWAEIINRQASNIATLARKSPAAGKTQVNAASAYSLADQALSSIQATSGSLKKLQDYLDDPGKSSKQTAANTAIANTLALIDKLLPSVAALADNLHGTSADAFATLWRGSRCSFLQPESNNTSWWLANQWSNTLFFQISERRRASQGRLTVNGGGQYHSLVISAGRSIGTQNRQTLRSSDFFEGINADSSRDGEASSPSLHFTSRPTSRDFNDRLAY